MGGPWRLSPTFCPHQYGCRGWRDSKSHQELMWERALLVTHMISKLMIDFLSNNIPRTPQLYHTSALSGEAWLIELILGHPDHICCELGMDVHTFKSVTLELHHHGHWASSQVSLEEQLGIFLYICITGLLIRHIGERFQRSNDTISRYVPIHFYLD